MVSIKSAPPLFSYLSAELLRDTEEKVRLANTNGLRAIAIADDIAGSKGLFFSIRFFIDIVLPIYKEIAAIMKENGLLAFFHSDGETKRVIDPLISAGYDCIHSVDTQAGLNPYALNKEFGESISFMGHIDIITWRKDQIDKEISLAENEFEKGGLILGSTCGISMKTVNDKLGVLYPQWQKEEI
jgi:uroporphyrinogen decarboxylase